MKCFDLFHNLEASSEQTYNVCVMPNKVHLIGKTNIGQPIFFIKNRETVRKISPIAMEWLQVSYDVRCSVKCNTEISESKYSTVLLAANDEILQSYFVDIMEVLLEDLPELPSSEELQTCIMNLIQIFSVKNNEPKKTVQGLWAELAIIYLSKAPQKLLSAWHSDPRSKMDFSYGSELLEVKSTCSEERRHSFSLDQLNPPAGIKELVASMVVREAGHGEYGFSVEDLKLRIQQKIDDDVLGKKLYSVILETLGKDYNKASTLYFNILEAKASLKFYDYKEVPHIQKDMVPAGVSGVDFKSDLSGIADISQKSPDYEISQTEMFRYLDY